MNIQPWIQWTRHGRWWTVPGFLAIFGVIMFLGPEIRWQNYRPLGSFSHRLFLIFIILITFIALKMFQRVSNRRIRMQGLDQMLAHHRVHPIYTVGASFEAHYDYLIQKQFKLVTGVDWSDLPWIIVLGTKNSGKSEMISHWGLKSFWNEPLIDWTPVDVDIKCWFTPTVVLIEIEDVMSTRVSLFLDFIQKNMKTHLIQSVVMVVSPEDLPVLASPNVAQTLAHLRALDQRLNDEVPFHFILSKADKINGFSNFFEYLTEKERAAIWGVNFDKGLVSAPEQLHVLFFKRFEEFFQRLKEKQIASLIADHPHLQLSQLLSFLCEVQALSVPLRHFLEECLKNTRRLSLKGIYMGGIVNESVPFFIQNLLKEEIWPNAVYQLDKLRTAKETYQMRYLFAVALLLVLLVNWLHAGKNTLHDLNQYQSYMSLASQNYQQYQAAHHLDERSLMRFFQNFRRALSFLKPEKRGWLTAIGQSTEKKLQQTFLLSYESKLRTALFPMVLKKTEKILMQSRNPQTIYDALKFYLMLGEPTRQDHDFMAHWLLEQVDIDFKDESDFKIDSLSVFGDLLHVIPPIVIHSDKVVTARQVLSEYPPEDYAYLVLTEHANLKYREPFHLALHLPPEFVSLFNNLDHRNKVDGFFTQAGYSKIFLPQLQESIQHLTEGDWVLGMGGRPDVDVEDFRRKILARYCLQYTRAWQGLLGSIEGPSFSDLMSAEAGMEILGQDLVGVVSAIVALVQKETDVPCVHEAFQALGNLQAYRPILDALSRSFSSMALRLREFNAHPHRVWPAVEKQALLDEIRTAQKRLGELPSPMDVWFMDTLEQLYDKIQAR